MSPDDVPAAGASDVEIIAALEELAMIGEDATGGLGGVGLDANWALARFGDLHFRRVLQLARIGLAAVRSAA